MLNCYCCEHFFNAFCGNDITVGAQYAALTLSSYPGASIEQWEILFITQYLNFILVDNEVSPSHSVEITSWIRYLSFFTVYVYINITDKQINKGCSIEFLSVRAILAVCMQRKCQVYSINATFVTICNMTKVRSLNVIVPWPSTNINAK